LPFNLFLQNNVTPSGSTYSSFLSEPKLRSAVVDALGPEKANSLFKGDVSVIATCGSGMTAVVLWLGLQLLGVKQVSLYDEVRIQFSFIFFSFLTPPSLRLYIVRAK
jgi:thiosulfate/3-mercaptopyruvate sulfurtransferase